ncbi:MAG: hypothetical protein QM715_14600 [Nibricoccus sp.]
MAIKEGPLNPRISSNMAGASAEGAAMIGVAIDAPPLKIVEAINAFVANPPAKGSDPVDNWTDRAMPLGSLWGTQMVRQFGWEWTTITENEEGGTKGIGVFDKKRSIGLYPFHFVFGCLETNSYPTILLAFNMLLAGKIPEMQAGEYINLMDGVRHVVPPR